jgi:hypothetical protein
MFKRDLELEREARKREAADLSFEREKATNLQSVLEDFQAGMYLTANAELHVLIFW